MGRRYRCLVCIRRGIVAAAKEDMAQRKVRGTAGNREMTGNVNIPKEDLIALLGCTKEGITYILDCYECRK